jgi:lysophospholipase L1-like esterase
MRTCVVCVLTALVAALHAAPAMSPQQTNAPAGMPQQALPPTTIPQQPPAAPVPNCPELAAALRTVTQNDVRNRDWANLTRYREANHRVTTPAGSEARVVFTGDSITDLWQQPRFGGFFPGKPYIDRGISAQTTPQMLLRFRADVIDLKPKAVVILAGTNDIAGNTGPMTNEEIQGNLQSMSELAQAAGIKVVLSSITPVSAYHVNPNGVPQTSARPMDRIKAVNAWMKQYAAANGHVYLDYFPAMTDASGMLQEDLSQDDLHPNAKGYAIMGPLADAAIARALSTR